MCIRDRRYLSSFGIEEMMNNGNQAQIDVRGIKQAIWKREMDRRDTVSYTHLDVYKRQLQNNPISTEEIADIAADIQRELETYDDPVKREYLPRFFKTGKGEYGEGDKFLGVVAVSYTHLQHGSCFRWRTPLFIKENLWKSFSPS